LSKCQELHQIANDAKEKLQQMQKDCLMKIDENCTTLAEKHKIEVTHFILMGDKWMKNSFFNNTIFTVEPQFLLTSL